VDTRDEPNEPNHDLEIKDAKVIFRSVWEYLEEKYTHKELRFPKEIILLGGAPGAGKGTQTEFIMKARGFTCEPIVISALLDSPEAKAIKDKGSMVGDREVIGILFEKMLDPQFIDGCVLDGFPRTQVQVECMKMLVDKFNQLHREFQETPLALSFRQPTIHVMVLFVTEKVSIERQLSRGIRGLAHNKEVRETGIGEIIDVRATDLDEDMARHRYRTFKEKTWSALQSLKEIYFYHFINAEGDIDDVEQNIKAELQYQSSLELEPQTFDRLRPIPLASEIVVHSRQDLVRRLDTYVVEHSELFNQVIELVKVRFMPIVLRHSISGYSIVNSEDQLLEDPLAMAMLIDIFSERGYHAVVDIQRADVPEVFDLETGKITCRSKKIWRIRITFAGSEIRRG